MDQSVLVAFDFDQTICDNNTDVVVQQLLPTSLISKEIQDLYKSSGWVIYMNKIFELLLDFVNYKQIEDAIINIPAVAGIEELLTSLKANGHEIIIISDSNSVFVGHWLKNRKLDHVISHVFTNPAHFDIAGRLWVHPYHMQHACSLSAINLCKGQILMDYIQERRKQGKNFKRIIYIGDGKNDLCPILRLSETDLACPRKNYALEDQLNKLSDSALIKAKIVLWHNGTDLRHSLEEIVKFNQ
ncbi:hypothetical protein P5V15_008413 [Pogonomyrmex californicus]